jgi:hypothetical protein
MVPPGWRTPNVVVYRRNLTVPTATIDGRGISTRFKQGFAHVPEAYDWESTKVFIVGNEYFARFLTKPYVIPMAAYLSVSLSFEVLILSFTPLTTDTSDGIVDEAGNLIEVGE